MLDKVICLNVHIEGSAAMLPPHFRQSAAYVEAFKWES